MFWTISSFKCFMSRGYLFVFTKNSVVNFAIFGRCVMFGAFVTFCPKWRLENRFSKGMYLKKACEPRHNVLFLVSEAGENLNRDHCAKHKHSGQKLRSSLHNLIVNTNKYPLALPQCILNASLMHHNASKVYPQCITKCIKNASKMHPKLHPKCIQNPKLHPNCI